METPDVLILLALLGLLVAVLLLNGQRRQSVERGRQRRERRILDRWHAKPPNEHSSSEGNHTP